MLSMQQLFHVWVEVNYLFNVTVRRGPVVAFERSARPRALHGRNRVVRCVLVQRSLRFLCSILLFLTGLLLHRGSLQAAACTSLSMFCWTVLVNWCSLQSVVLVLFRISRQCWKSVPCLLLKLSHVILVPNRNKLVVVLLVLPETRGYLLTWYLLQILEVCKDVQLVAWPSYVLKLMLEPLEELTLELQLGLQLPLALLEGTEVLFLFSVLLLEVLKLLLEVTLHVSNL